jgi:hypothetical protein
MSDIVERLRKSVTKGHQPTDEDAIEAANEIERLRTALGKQYPPRPWGEDMSDILRNHGDAVAMVHELQAEIEKVWRPRDKEKGAKIERLRARIKQLEAENRGDTC